MPIKIISTMFAERREKYAAGNETDIADRIFAKMVKQTEDGRKLEGVYASGTVFKGESCEGARR